MIWNKAPKFKMHRNVSTAPKFFNLFNLLHVLSFGLTLFALKAFHRSCCSFLRWWLFNTSCLSVLPCSLSKHSTAHVALFWDGDCLTVKYVRGGAEFGLWFWGAIRGQVEISLISFCSEIYFRKKSYWYRKVFRHTLIFNFCCIFKGQFFKKIWREGEEKCQGHSKPYE